MPNWVSTSINVVGTNDEIKKVTEFVKSEESDFDFNKVIPMPEELNITDCSRGKTGEEYLRAIAIPADKRTDKDLEVINRFKKFEAENPDSAKEALELGQKYIDNVEKYGFRTWYDWRRYNWGTKWNASDAWANDGLGGCFGFNTAWCFCEPVIQRLSELFPEVSIDFVFADEDAGCNTGRGTYKAGELVSEDFPDDGTDAAYEIFLETHIEYEDILYKDENGEWKWDD